MSILTGALITKLVAVAAQEKLGDPSRPVHLRNTLPGEVSAASLWIDPFDPKCVGPNSYDVHLDAILHYYAIPNDRGPDGRLRDDSCLDFMKPLPTRTILLDDTGFVLRPGVLYLGSTVERTETTGVVPYLDGRSSVGRYGVQIHMTAGRGDDGFRGHWTMEITCVHPVRVYPKMKIGQLTFHTIVGPRKPYEGRYQDQSAAPTPSRFHQTDPDTSDFKDK